MKTIPCDKIVGLKIWKNENDGFATISVLETHSSHRMIEFKSLEQLDNFIKKLKCFKKDFIERPY